MRDGVLDVMMVLAALDDAVTDAGGHDQRRRGKSSTARKPQLANSSIEGGSIDEYTQDGQLAAIIGAQRGVPSSLSFRISYATAANDLRAQRLELQGIVDPRAQAFRTTLCDRCVAGGQELGIDRG